MIKTIWGIYEEEDGRTVECEAGHDDAGKATVKAAQLISVYVIWFCFYHSHQQTNRKRDRREISKLDQ